MITNQDRSHEVITKNSNMGFGSLGSISLPHFLRENKIFTRAMLDFLWINNLRKAFSGNFGMRELLKELLNPHQREINCKMYWEYVNREGRRVAKDQFGLRFTEETPSRSLKEIFLDGIYITFSDFMPSPGEVVLDIGSQYGDFALLCAKFFRSSKVKSFEPLVGNFRILKDNIFINNALNVEAHNMAIGKEIGEISIEYAGDMAVNGGGEGAQNVNMSTLDAVVDHKPDLIKIDVEGFELDVLEGAAITLEKYHPRIIIETHSKLLKKGVITILSRYGYSVVHEGRSAYMNRPGMDMTQNVYFE